MNVGVNSGIGVGVIQKRRTSNAGVGGNARLPEQFVVTNGPQRKFTLSSAARGVVVMLNRKPQIQTTQNAPNKDFAHITNSTDVDFSFDVVNGEVVTILPID
jgi:hypothetical protein